MKTDALLTKRESQVVRLYAEGYIGKEIADILQTSYYTVVNHTQNVYEKLGIRRSTNALVAWWFCINFDISLSGETARKTIATLLLGLFMATMTSFDDTYIRRVRRGRVEENEMIGGFGIVTEN